MKTWHNTIPRMRTSRVVRLLGFLMFSILLFAESVAAQSGGMYIYPAKGQDQNKQNEDRYDCHSWAVSQTGFDPKKPQANAPGSSGDPQNRPSARPVLRRGARGGGPGARGRGESG